jgi:hypothetical protein
MVQLRGVKLRILGTSPHILSAYFVKESVNVISTFFCFIDVGHTSRTGGVYRGWERRSFD